MKKRAITLITTYHHRSHHTNILSDNRLRQNGDKGDFQTLKISEENKIKIEYIYTVKKVFDFPSHPYHQIALRLCHTEDCVGDFYGDCGDKGDKR